MDDGWVYLCGAAQDIEADIICGLLDEQRIPARKIYLGAGEFTKIASGLTCGVEIYVPREHLTVAKETIAAEENQSWQVDDGTGDLNGRGDRNAGDQFGLNESYQDGGVNLAGGFSRWWVGVLVILIVLVVIFIVHANRLF